MGDIEKPDKSPEVGSWRECVDVDKKCLLHQIALNKDGGLQINSAEKLQSFGTYSGCVKIKAQPNVRKQALANSGKISIRARTRNNTRLLTEERVRRKSGRTLRSSARYPSVRYTQKTPLLSPIQETPGTNTLRKTMQRLWGTVQYGTRGHQSPL